MKKEPKKVFILSENQYKEITYAKLKSLRKMDETYSDKHFFIPIQGMLMEVLKKQYDEFYKDVERSRYLKKLDKESGLLSIETFDSEDDNGADFIGDASTDVEQTVIHKMLLEKLNDCLPLLSVKEKKLIDALFYQGLSERDYVKF